MNKARINDFIEALIELSDKFGIYIGCSTDQSLPCLYDEKGHMIAKDFEYKGTDEFNPISDFYAYDYLVFEVGDKVKASPFGIGTIIEIADGKWASVLVGNCLHRFNINQLEHIDEKTKNMY